MANTVVTLEDLLSLETRMKAFIIHKLHELGEKPKPMFYTPAEVAEMVGLGVHAIRHKLRDPNEKTLKGVQTTGPRGTWLIPKESVEAWLAGMKNKHERS